MTRVLHTLSTVVALGIGVLATAQNDTIGALIQRIDENSARILVIDDWSSEEVREVPGSAEGGAAHYYYDSGELKKIVLDLYGETGRRHARFEFLDGHLVKVIETNSQYREPLSVGRAVEVVQEKNVESYLFNSTVIRQVGSTASAKEETARLLVLYQDLMERLHRRRG